MKKITIFCLSTILSLVPFVSAFGNTDTAQVLVSINNLNVTDQDLEEALRSSPFYTQFNAMSEQEQGTLRGNILKRLVTSRLLSLEAKASELENSPAFLKELDNFRTGLLYKFYMDKLRGRIKIPDSKMAEFRQKGKGNRDDITAAISSYRNDQYRNLYKLTIQNLRDKYHVVLHENKVAVGTAPETVVLEGENGIRLTMAQVLESDNQTTYTTKDQLLEKIYKLAELQVVAQAAKDEDVNVTKQINDYKRERLPALFIEKKQQEWTKNEADLKKYYDAHPEASIIPQRWHIGMIVLKTKEQAEKVLARINKGESLFKLAGELSIDPYGKKHNGDIGWVRENSGNPVIENAIKDLPDGKPSQVIETKKGFIIATILDRRPGGVRRFAGIKDKIKQLVINEKMHNYLADLQQKYEIDWKLLTPAPQQDVKPILKEAKAQ